MKKMPLDQLPYLITITFLTVILAGCSKTTPVPQPPNSNATAMILSISVDSGYYTTKVIIKGSGFSSTISDDVVAFNGIAAVVTSASSTQIITSVPLAAGTGPVSVTVAGATATGPSFLYKPTEVVTTFAGNFNPGTADGQGTAASFSQPFGITIDHSGNFYVSDQEGNRIRKITPGGLVSTFAGSGSQGFADGAATAATFSLPAGLTTDASGNVFVADMGNGLIREISPAGQVTTFAGNRLPHSIDGQGTAASFNGPVGITSDASGNLYVVEESGGVAREITPSALVSTIASGLNNPTGVAVDPTGNLYEVDQFYSLIQKITPAGVITRVAGSSQGFTNGTGSGAQFNLPTGIAIDKNGNLYVADTQNHMVRKITPAGVVTTLAGNGNQGMDNGPAMSATFIYPLGVAVDNLGNVFVVDGDAIREITYQ